MLSEQQPSYQRPVAPPPPPTRATGALHSASRHRRSLGTTVSEVVDRQIAEGQDRRKSSLQQPHVSGGYSPSFGPRQQQQQQRRSSLGGATARDLEDVNEALAHRLVMRPRGSGVQIGDSRPKEFGGYQNPAPPPTASSDALFTRPSMPPMRRSLSTHGPAKAEESASTRNRGGVASTTSRRTSLGLFYGPIQSSYDHRANTTVTRGITGKAGVTASRGLVHGNQGEQVLDGSIDSSWRQQVEAANARVTARSILRPQHRRPNSVVREDDGGYFKFPSDSTTRRIQTAAAPNTLTLDNWFDAGGDEGELMGESDQSDLNFPQMQPRRRSSVSSDCLAPLPDVDDDNGSSTMELRDLDEHERRQSLALGRPEGSTAFIMPKGGKGMTLELATALRNLIFGGVGRTFSQGWLNQGLEFGSLVKFGLVQHRGGPCGVLAAVQAHVAQALAFGMHGVDDTTRAVDPLAPTETERDRALSAAIIAILRRCSPQKKSISLALPSSKNHFTGIGRYRSDGVTETLELHELPADGADLTFIRRYLHFFVGGAGVIAILFSALLSRGGAAAVASDMDSEDLPLMGAHGYCSQEMVNLLLTGRAVSNTFDRTVILDSAGTVLRGVESRSDVGLLSLFEHYGSCAVGENLKTPAHPAWVVCSESHFSTLFALEPGAERSGRAERPPPLRLFYYDGLGRHDELYRLTVDCSAAGIASSSSRAAREQLVPPLEHCIRTKWRDARVDWNGSEKIL